MFKFPNTNSKGFTLMEIIMSMAILSGVVLVVSIFSFDVFDFGIFLGENIVSQQELQITLRSMTTEIRAMAQSINGAYPIESASQNSVTFYSDIDGDGYAEKIRYFIQGNILKKGVVRPSGSPLAYSGIEDISDLVHNLFLTAGNIFSYYNSNYSGTQAELTFPINIPTVRLIKVNLTVDPNPLDVSSRVNFNALINIRNL